MDRTEGQLEQASEHVKYEIDMLRATASFLSVSWSATDQVTRYAYLESFVLHLRNLIDFLYPPPNRHPDDILSDHYVSRVTEWNGRRPAKTPLLSDAKDRANKLGAHLSYRRADRDKAWDWVTILVQLKPVFSCFLDHLPEARKAWFAGTELGVPAGPTGAPSSPVVRGATGPLGPSTSAGSIATVKLIATRPAEPPTSEEFTTRK